MMIFSQAKRFINKLVDVINYFFNVKTYEFYIVCSINTRFNIKTISFLLIYDYFL